MTKTYIIHEIRPTLTSPGYRLEVVAHHGRLGTTLDFQTVWPDAAHPLPHRAMQLTLPPEAFGRLADVIAKKGGACPTSSSDWLCDDQSTGEPPPTAISADKDFPERKCAG